MTSTQVLAFSVPESAGTHDFVLALMEDFEPRDSPLLHEPENC
jgi:hypothetical protein